jgi:predicted DNA-binding ribbon-helix-helix protein
MDQPRLHDEHKLQTATVMQLRPAEGTWRGVLRCQEEVVDTLIKRSFSLAGRRTSVALEQEFWAAPMHIAASRQQTITALVAEADARRPVGRPLASALRVLALQELFPQAPPLVQ